MHFSSFYFTFFLLVGGLSCFYCTWAVAKHVKKAATVIGKNGGGGCIQLWSW